MTPLGNSVKIQPKPYERFVRGIYYPDTVTPPNMEWGVVTDGNGIVENGSRVLYFGKKCFQKDGEKIVNKAKLIIWDL